MADEKDPEPEIRPMSSPPQAISAAAAKAGAKAAEALAARATEPTGAGDDADRPPSQDGGEHGAEEARPTVHTPEAGDGGDVGVEGIDSSDIGVVAVVDEAEGSPAVAVDDAATADVVGGAEQAEKRPGTVAAMPSEAEAGAGGQPTPPASGSEDVLEGWDVKAEARRVAEMRAGAAKRASHAEFLVELWEAKEGSFDEVLDHQVRLQRAQEAADKSYALAVNNWRSFLETQSKRHAQLIKFFEGRAAADARYAADIFALRELVDKSPTPTDSTAEFAAGSSLSACAHHLSLLHQELSARVAEFGDRTTQEIIEQTMSKLESTYDTVAKTVLEQSETELSKLRASSKRAQEAYGAYSDLWTEYQTARSTGKPIEKDQWLVELGVRQAARKLEQSREGYVQQMSDLFKQMTELEQTRTSKLQQAIQRYSQLTRRLFAGFDVPTEEVITATKVLETRRDFVNALRQKTAEMDAAHGSTARSAPVVQTAVQSKLVVAWGRLQRQSGMLRRWSDVLGVVTLDGWFHIFDITEDLAFPPDWRSSDVPGISRRKRGHAKSTTAASTTASSLAPAKDEPKLGTTAAGPLGSLNLHHSKLSFCPAVHKWAFEVSETVSSMIFFSSSKKLQLKAMSQDDMVEWMVALNEATDPTC